MSRENEFNLDGKEYLEDSLLNKKTIELIRDVHSSWLSLPEVEVVLRHKKVNGMEVDGIIILKHKTLRRFVGVELKEYNIVDAITQAKERRKFFNYFYIITRFPRKSLGSIIRDILFYEEPYYRPKFFELYENKIGWIVYDEKYPPLLMFPSFFIKVDFKNLTFIKNLKGSVVDLIWD